MIFEVRYTIAADELDNLFEQQGRVLDFPALGFPAGSLVIVGITVDDQSDWSEIVSGKIALEVEDFLGRAAYVSPARFCFAWFSRLKKGWWKVPELIQVRDFASIDVESFK